MVTTHISEQVERKIDALMAHTSQNGPRADVLPGMIREWAEANAKASNTGFSRCSTKRCWVLVMTFQLWLTSPVSIRLTAQSLIPYAINMAAISSGMNASRLPPGGRGAMIVQKG